MAHLVEVDPGLMARIVKLIQSNTTSGKEQVSRRAKRALRRAVMNFPLPGVILVEKRQSIPATGIEEDINEEALGPARGSHAAGAGCPRGFCRVGAGNRPDPRTGGRQY